MWCRRRATAGSKSRLRCRNVPSRHSSPQRSSQRLRRSCKQSARRWRQPDIRRYRDGTSWRQSVGQGWLTRRRRWRRRRMRRRRRTQPRNWRVRCTDFFWKMRCTTRFPAPPPLETDAGSSPPSGWTSTKGTRRRQTTARLVGRELKLDSPLDLFAATLPLDAIRINCSLCANNQYGQQPYPITTVDVKRSYFYSRSRRPVYIEIPIEDSETGDEHMVGRLSLCLHGTRDASQNWTREYTKFLESVGFRSGLASPCNFFHKQKELF